MTTRPTELHPMRPKLKALQGTLAVWQPQGKQVDIDGQMLMRAEIIDDAATCFAVNHVRVEPARATGQERANPGHGLAAEPVDKRVVLDREWDVASRFRKHDATPRSDV